MQNVTLNRSHLGEQRPGMDPVKLAKNLERYKALADKIVKQYIEEIMN